jgi:hypothetical protein
MAKKAIQLVEKFSKTIYVYDGKEFPGDDIDETDMIAMLSSTFPEVSNATTETTIKDEIRYIEFIKKAGTKGASSAEIVAKLDTLHPMENLNEISFKLLTTNTKPLIKQGQIIEEHLLKARERISGKINIYSRLIHIQPTVSSAVIQGI